MSLTVKINRTGRNDTLHVLLMASVAFCGFWDAAYSGYVIKDPPYLDSASHFHCIFHEIPCCVVVGVAVIVVVLADDFLFIQLPD